MGKRYRYILNGGATKDSQISDFRLIAPNHLQGFDTAVRVTIPANAKLEKWKCDEYSTWDDEQSYVLSELDPKICVKINGTWTILEDATRNWLNGMELHESCKQHMNALYDPTTDSMFGYITTDSVLGYLTKSQKSWYDANKIYAWRLSKIPAHPAENMQFPPLTQDELETLAFIRKEIQNHIDDIIDKERFYFDDTEEKEAAKAFFHTYFKEVSDDELAYRWHKQSAYMLDPTRRFETVKMIERLKRSRYAFVHDEHYRHAFEELLEHSYGLFYAHWRKKSCTQTDISQ